MNGRISSCLSVIIDRIRRSCESGLLKGVRFYDYPINRPQGQDDLPNITLIEYRDNEESFMAGATTGTGKSTNIVRNECSVYFLVSFSRENGSIRPETNSRLALIDYVERLKDSIEVNKDGQIDLQLEGTCMEPLYISVDDSDPSDLSWNVLFQVEFFPLPYPRGSRTEDIPSSGLISEQERESPTQAPQVNESESIINPTSTLLPRINTVYYFYGKAEGTGYGTGYYYPLYETPSAGSRAFKMQGSQTIDLYIPNGVTPYIATNIPPSAGLYTRHPFSRLSTSVPYANSIKVSII